MIQQRPQFASLLDFVEIDGFENPGRLDSALENIDAVIHVASVCIPYPVNTLRPPIP